jgi:hypothetical protein
MSLGPCPDLILLEDAEDLVNFLIMSGRVVDRDWCDEVVASRNAMQNAGFADSFF